MQGNVDSCMDEYGYRDSVEGFIKRPPCLLYWDSPMFRFGFYHSKKYFDLTYFDFLPDYKKKKKCFF